MKKFIGWFILVIVLVAASGCTQQVKPAPVTTPETTVPTVVTTAETPLPPTTVPTTVATITATTATPTPKPIQTPSTKLTIIYIRNNTFVPTELTVLPGTGITWVNEDATVHAVKTTGNHTGMFNSGDIIPGGRWGYTFGEREGTFEFTCPYHPDMTGMIVIKKGQSVYGAPSLQPRTP